MTYHNPRNRQLISAFFLFLFVFSKFFFKSDFLRGRAEIRWKIDIGFFFMGAAVSLCVTMILLSKKFSKNFSMREKLPVPVFRVVCVCVFKFSFHSLGL